MSESEPERRRIRIPVRTKFLLAFLGLSTVALLLAGSLAFTQMNDVGSYALDRSTDLGIRAMNDSTAALERNAEESLLRLAQDQAYISNIVFEQVSGDLEVMERYATTLQGNPSMVRPRHFYLQDEEPADRRSTSVLFLSPGIDAGLLSEERNAAGMMDDIFIPISATNRHLANVYVGTGSGMAMIYPWTAGLDATCDPRLRSWFVQANGAGGAVWSEPYVDLIGHGLMVTCSRPVYTSGRDWVWVVGADVTIETINQQIIGTQVGDRGYAMLIDSHGNVISRPGLTSGDLRWDESFVTENLLASENPDLVAVAGKMTAGESGVARVGFDDGERFIAYAPVRSVNWSVGVVMPVDEVLAPIEETRTSIFQASEDTVQHISGQQETMKAVFTGTFLGLLAVVALLTLVVTRHITRPIEELQRGSEAIGRGDLDHRVEVATGDEFEDLACSFNKMAADLKGHVEDLRRTTAEKERVAKELEIAKEIQQSILPESAPVLPGFDLAGFNLPAREVGGDFFDYIPVGEGCWGVEIADVSGKGVPAALFMALSRTLVRASASENPDPAGSILEANRYICMDSKTCMFVTLFYGILDTRKGTFTYVNAGHNPPLLFRKGSTVAELLQGKGIALGIFDDIELELVELRLNSGDTVVFYTDGVTEATNERDEEYGTERLTTLIPKLVGLGAREMIAAIVEDVTTHAGSQPQFDDITLVVLKVG
ncbi:SpoIIE family protein phosphatase [Methanoculleus horonobensis]|jgi:sigma-B regulation protein RsbU (phosphoserine phosphatase)|uniref:SpoIIE family protein phosphatase n=1 Tax=Methanoculleus horonobensis TaxID=528314 RepID=UPI000835B3E8|nr:SpoIIE family protein phosphatase [Methanoculleus horonobensis]MDD3070264.1 SpoIIE family protein phosphatase [Methanoculleus horonobensis]MDD4252980.1 SpoIIE family protein phosphatase [Methanoculleus horonobensis]